MPEPTPVNANLDFTYTSLAPLSERQQEALESGLNPQLFQFTPEDVAPASVPLSPQQFLFTGGRPEVTILPSGPPAVVTSSVPRKRSGKKKKGTDDDTR